jgi:hypothetical protein
MGIQMYSDIKILPFPEQDMDFLQRTAEVVRSHNISITDEQLDANQASLAQRQR